MQPSDQVVKRSCDTMHARHWLRPDAGKASSVPDRTPKLREWCTAPISGFGWSVDVDVITSGGDTRRCPQKCRGSEVVDSARSKPPLGSASNSGGHRGPLARGLSSLGFINSS